MWETCAKDAVPIFFITSVLFSTNIFLTCLKVSSKWDKQVNSDNFFQCVRIENCVRCLGFERLTVTEHTLVAILHVTTRALASIARSGVTRRICDYTNTIGVKTRVPKSSWNISKNTWFLPRKILCLAQELVIFMFHHTFLEKKQPWNPE